MLLKEIKEDINKWKDILCSWFERVTIVRMSILPEVTNRFKIQITFLCRNRKIHPKMYIESQETLNNQNNFEKEEQSWKSHTS